MGEMKGVEVYCSHSMDTGVFFSLYAIALPLFIALDLLWVGYVANRLYNQHINHLQGPVNWMATGIFYGIFMLGLTYFALYPAVMRGTLYTALILGALFGLFTYATYNLTNMATLRGWTWPMTVVNILWGVALGAMVAGATYWIYTSYNG